MGEAKRRGTREQRVEQGRARRAQELALLAKQYQRIPRDSIIPPFTDADAEKLLERVREGLPGRRLQAERIDLGYGIGVSLSMPSGERIGIRIHLCEAVEFPGVMLAETRPAELERVAARMVAGFTKWLNTPSQVNVPRGPRADDGSSIILL